MGLKQAHFVDWLQLRFPAAVRPIHIRENAKFDSVFIDVNCILHPAIRSSKNEAEFVKRLYLTLDKLLKQCIPVRCCYLSVDSSAPFAKLALQKDRRRTKGSKTKTGRMSTLQITPGCPFMIRLEHYLDYYAVRYLQQRQGKGISPDLKFIIDHANNPGEGECKIVENIIQQKDNIRGRPCALISLDSDTILQALTLAIPNMYVIRKEKSKQHVAISVDHLMQKLEELFPNGGSIRARLDFCAICMFRGNDYLRGMPLGIDRLWNSYIFTKTKDTIIKGSKNLWLLDAQFKCFDLVFLRQLMKNAIKMPKTPNRLPPPNRLTPNLLKDAMARLAAAATAPSDNSGDNNDEADLSDVDASDMESDSECDTSMLEEDDDEETPQDPYCGGPTPRFSVDRYLQAVLWNIEFYSSGVCPDVSFVYGLQVAPKAADIVAYIDCIEKTKSLTALQPEAVSKDIGVPTSKADYPSPLVCALMVTPLDSGAKYLPASVARIHSTVDDKGSILQPGRMDEIDNEVRSLIVQLRQSRDPKDRHEAALLHALHQKHPPYLWTRTRPGVFRSSTKVLPRTPMDVLAFKHEAGATTVATMTPSVPPMPVSTEPAETPSIQSSDQSKKFVSLEKQPDIVCLTNRLPLANKALQEIQPLKRYPWVDTKQELNKNPSWPFFPVGSGFRGSPSIAKKKGPSSPATSSSSSMADKGADSPTEGTTTSMSVTASGNSSDSATLTTINAANRKPKRVRNKDMPRKPSSLSKESSAAMVSATPEQAPSNISVCDPDKQIGVSPTSSILPPPAPVQPQPTTENKVDLMALLHASMARFQLQENSVHQGPPPASVQPSFGTSPTPSAPQDCPRPPSEQSTTVETQPLPQIHTNTSLKAFVPLSVQSSLAAQRAKTASKLPQGRVDIPK